jgi:hypothetical protein
MYRNKKRNSNLSRYYHLPDNLSSSTVLKSGFTVDQTFNGLKKAWRGYTIAKNKGERDRLEYYASVIQKLQKEIGFTSGLATFPGLDINPKV